MPSPSGNMKAADAVLMATWCAACAVALIQPAMTGTTAKMPTSLRLCSPAGQPVVSKRRKTASLETVGPADFAAPWRIPKADEHQDARDERGPAGAGQAHRREAPVAEHPQPVEEDVGEDARRQARPARSTAGAANRDARASAWKARPGTMAQDMRMKNSWASAVTSGDEPSSGMNCAEACESAAATTLMASASTMPCRRIAGADSSTPAPLSCD